MCIISVPTFLLTRSALILDLLQKVRFFMIDCYYLNIFVMLIY